MDLEKVIFVDADQIVRVDMQELVDVDLQGRVYGMTPMGDDRVEMEGFRFWKTGYWKDALHGNPYHIRCADHFVAQRKSADAYQCAVRCGPETFQAISHRRKSALFHCFIRKLAKVCRIAFVGNITPYLLIQTPWPIWIKTCQTPCRTRSPFLLWAKIGSGVRRGAATRVWPGQRRLTCVKIH